MTTACTSCSPTENANFRRAVDAEHRGPVVLHDLDVVDGDPDPAEELAPVEFHPVLLFVADVEREIYVQTHRRILPHGASPPRDPHGGRRLRGCLFLQLTRFRP